MAGRFLYFSKSFQIFIFILFIFTESKAQNSTAYGLVPRNTFSIFTHLDLATGITTFKDTLTVIEQLGTSTYDPETRNYFIAGYRDTLCVLLTIYAPTGKIVAEQPLTGNSEWHGFEFDYNTKKIYGTRMNTTNYDFYLATIDPVNKTYSEVSMGKNSASQVGSAMDYKNGYYFFGSSAGGFKLNTIDIHTGNTLYAVPINLPTGSYHYDTAAKQLYGIYTSVPKVIMAKMDYKGGKHTYDSVPYLRAVSIISSWYTYDRANGNYILPTDHNGLINIINAENPEVIHEVSSQNIITELEYDATLPGNAAQISGILKSSAGGILSNAMVYAAIKNTSGNFELTDSIQANPDGIFTLTSSQKDFYIYIKPSSQQSATQAPTWFPRTVHAADAQLFNTKKGINYIELSTKDISALPIDEPANKCTIKIYPNPAYSSISIQTDVAIQRIYIVDIYGRLIISRQYNNSNNILFELPENMKNGVYQLKLYANDRVIVKSFIKQ